ncbi:unnamed protein product, partial [Choristocarpus tenellus]
SDFNSFETLLQALRTCKRIVVITGAGISVSCGIPDFRSENGVYQLVQQFNLGLDSPEDLFDLGFFTEDPKPFFKFAKALYPGNYNPSPTHRFLRVLEEQGKLLKNYTQNIDGLEAQVGLKRYIPCHGSFLTASCLSCKAKKAAEDIKEEVMHQQVPHCHCGGVIKPDITFFGEKLSTTVNRSLEADQKKADLLIVMGTSLKVAPVSRILHYMPRDVPQVLINRELVHPLKSMSDGFDLHLLGDCDTVVNHICDRLGWKLPGGDTACSRVGAGEGGRKMEGVKGKGKGKQRVRGQVEGEHRRDNIEEGEPPPPVFIPPNSFVFASGAKGAGGSFDGNLVAACTKEKRGKEGEEEEEEEFEEVVTCDACDKVVEGAVYSCRECFGFDLCGQCHSRGRNAHAKEKGHAFRRSDGIYAMGIGA